MLVLTYLVCCLFGFGGDVRFHFGFCTDLTVSASNLVKFSLAVSLTFFRSLADGYCLYSAISVRLVGNISLINLLKGGQPKLKLFQKYLISTSFESL